MLPRPTIWMTYTWKNRPIGRDIAKPKASRKSTADQTYAEFVLPPRSMVSPRRLSQGIQSSETNVKGEWNLVLIHHLKHFCAHSAVILLASASSSYTWPTFSLERQIAYST